MTADKIIVSLRPNLSLNTPESNTPTIEPTKAQPTYQPCCNVSNWNICATCEVVPDITAVSYPNKKPPNAATTDRNTK